MGTAVAAVEGLVSSLRWVQFSLMYEENSINLKGLYPHFYYIIIIITY